MDWEPGYWYDRLTFTVIEYDRPSSSINIEIGVEYNKKNISKTGLDAAVGVKHEIKFDNNGEKCGSSYLNYFDNPEQWLVFPNYGVKILVSEKDN